MFQSIRREASDRAHYIAQFRSLCAVMLGLCGVFCGACITACSPTERWARSPYRTHILAHNPMVLVAHIFGLYEGVARLPFESSLLRAGICLVALVYRHRHFRWRASSAVSTTECVSLSTRSKINRNKTNKTLDSRIRTQIE